MGVTATTEEDYLTLNFNLSDKFLPPLGAVGAAGEEPPANCDLKHAWCVWEQLAPEKTSRTRGIAASPAKVCKIENLVDFWNVFAWLPQPSVILNGHGMKSRINDGKRVADVYVFKRGIEPRWEDPQNALGGHFTFNLNQKTLTTTAAKPGLADEYWNTMIMGILGGTFPLEGMVAGIRLSDRTGLKLPSIRLEVWCKGEAGAGSVRREGEDWKQLRERFIHELIKLISTGVNGKQKRSTEWTAGNADEIPPWQNHADH